MTKEGRYHRPGSEIVAIVLAVGIGTALNFITFATIYIAIVPGASDVPGGLSENASQILLAWGGAVIGVLSAYVGYTFGVHRSDSDKTPPKEPLP